MNPYKKTAKIVGVLFLLGFAGIVTTILVKPILDDPNCLVKIIENRTRVVIGVLFQATMSFAVAGIAIWMYPVLKKHDEALALWSIAFRIIEVVLQFISTLCLLLLLTVSREYVSAGVPDSSYYKTVCTLLLAGNDWAFGVLSQMAFVLGASIYYYLFYRSRLIPRWLSAWGLLAALSHLTGVFLIIFDQLVLFSSTQILFALPIAMQELALAAWLIMKGFNPSAIKVERYNNQMNRPEGSAV